jgi:hypothetical protein
MGYLFKFKKPIPKKVFREMEKGDEALDKARMIESKFYAGKRITKNEFNYLKALDPEIREQDVFFKKEYHRFKRYAKKRGRIKR